MVKLKKWIISTLGLPGSWKWACKKMDEGCTVRPDSAAGSVRYKLDHENQRRIVWTFERNPRAVSDWNSANIFLSDFESIDWVCVK